MIKTKIIIALALCSVSLASFGSNLNEASPEMAPLMATPKAVTVERNCSTFVSIENKTSCNVYYKQAEQFKISIVAPQENVDKIKTTVADGVLVIEMEDKSFIKDTKNVKINVESPSLTDIVVSGSGDIAAQTSLDTSGKPLTIEVKGSGNLKFKKVECDVISIVVSGSGNAVVEDVKASSSDIDIKGSGNVNLNRMKISKKIDLAIHGSGNISVNGSVDDVKASIQGSGNITGRVDCDNVNAVIKGSGDVKFSGDVKSHNTTVTGSGRVTIK